MQANNIDFSKLGDNQQNPSLNELAKENSNSDLEFLSTQQISLLPDDVLEFLQPELTMPKNQVCHKRPLSISSYTSEEGLVLCPHLKDSITPSPSSTTIKIAHVIKKSGARLSIESQG